MSKKYLLLMLNKEMPTPKNKEEAEAMAKPWEEWLGKMSNEGKIDNGLPVQRNGKVVRKRSVKDYTAKTNDIGGYLIVKADSMEEAIKIAQSSPAARLYKGTTIVRECMDMNM